MTDDAAAFGTRLCICRQLAALSQEELAERSALSVRAVRNLETGRTKSPHPGSIRRLAAVLELRGEARREFFLAASRLVRGASTSIVAVPGSRLVRADGGQAVPRQLPGPVQRFVGRDDELVALTGLLDRSDATPPAAVIAAITGTAGVGKSALAVHWAHRVTDRFPDGQLYVNLRGYDLGQPIPAADALAGFLRALGVPGPDVPAAASERAARFRSMLAGQRMLVVLDNAGQVEQVRPLLPGTPTCVTVVTSRDALPGLVARDGAVRLDLDPLPLAEAVRLLVALIGPRAAADPGATEAVAEGCSRLPLALRLAAELAEARSATHLADLAGELADEQQRLDMLDAGGDPSTAIRAVFSWPYQHLDPDAARLFRLLSLHPGHDVDPDAAAALAATTVRHARRVLEVLVRARLIKPVGPVRHAMHDLLRTYGRERAYAEDSEDERRAALTRLFNYYLYTAATAMHTLFPTERYLPPRIAPPATAVAILADAARARAWMDGEQANLVTFAAYAAGHGWSCHAARLSAAMSRYLAGGARHQSAT